MYLTQQTKKTVKVSNILWGLLYLIAVGCLYILIFKADLIVGGLK